MQEKTQAVAALVLGKLEGYLRSDAPIDPQKCKHITATLKDIQDLYKESPGPQQITVIFDQAAEEAAK